jgi:hypothetical protein
MLNRHYTLRNLEPFDVFQFEYGDEKEGKHSEAYSQLTEFVMYGRRIAHFKLRRFWKEKDGVLYFIDEVIDDGRQLRVTFMIKEHDKVEKGVLLVMELLKDIDTRDVVDEGGPVGGCKDLSAEGREDVDVRKREKGRDGVDVRGKEEGMWDWNDEQTYADHMLPMRWLDLSYMPRLECFEKFRRFTDKEGNPMPDTHIEKFFSALANLAIYESYTKNQNAEEETGQKCADATKVKRMLTSMRDTWELYPDFASTYTNKPKCLADQRLDANNKERVGNIVILLYKCDGSGYDHFRW